MENKVESGLNWIRVRFSYSGKKGEDAGGDTLVLLVTFRVAEGARPDRKSSLCLLARAVLYRLCFLLSEQLLPERKTMSQSKLEWRRTQIDEQVYSIIEWLKCVIMAHRGDVALKDSRSLEPPLDRKPSLWPHLTWYQKLFSDLIATSNPADFILSFRHVWLLHWCSLWIHSDKPPTVAEKATLQALLLSYELKTTSVTKFCH